MAPRGRETAIGALKDTLVGRFGAASRDVVEAEVEGRLAGKAKMERDDLDAIEHSVLTQLKQRRTGTFGGASHKALSRSAPNLTAEPPKGPNPRLGQTPAPPAANLGAASRRPPPGVEKRPGSAGSRMSVASRAGIGRTVGPPTLGRTLAKVTSASEIASKRGPGDSAEPPFGRVIVGLDDEDNRSCVVCKPVHPVPLRPKIKALDHWDLMVAFDGKKHQEEMAAYSNVGKQAERDKWKKRLDDQMIEVNAIKEEKRQAKLQENRDMLARIEEAKQVDAAEKAHEKAKADLQNKMNTEMLDSLNERKRKDHEKKMKNQAEMQAWMAREKQRQEDEKREAAEENARKQKKAMEEMQEMLRSAARQKKEKEAAEKAYVAAQKAGMDDAEKAGRDAVQARMDQIDRNCAGIGEMIKAKDAKQAADLAASIKKALEKQDRAAREDAEFRKNTFERKTREMIASLDAQCAERGKDKVADKAANARQAKIWQEEYEEGLRQDNAKAEGRRQARASQDKELVHHMRAHLSVHPRNHGITGYNQTLDVGYNKAIFQQMVEEGFAGELPQQMMTNVKADTRGKVDPFPSIGRYEGEIHEMEQMVPDVG